MGHNLGMLHNTDTPGCENGPTIMSGIMFIGSSDGPATQFAECSKSEFARWFAAVQPKCMDNEPYR
jgi:hypothetical protein